MRIVSRLGLFSAVALVGLAIVRVVVRGGRGGAREGALPFVNLLPEDGFGGPGVFRGPVSETPTAKKLPAKTAAKKSSAKKSPAKKPAAPKPAAKTVAMNSPVKKRPSR